MDYTIEKYSGEDLSGLKHIWKVCFGDSDEFLNIFFDGIYKDSIATVATVSGKPCAAMYILPCGTLPRDGREYSCCYLYALGTLPEYRGLGIGSAVVQAAVGLSKEQGYDICITSPAEEGLFDYYRKLGFREFSAVSPVRWTGGTTPAGSVIPTNTAEYMRLRRQRADAAVFYSEEYMSFLGEMLHGAGGGFFSLDTPDGKCLAAAAKEGSYAVVKELICPGDPQIALALIAEHLSAINATAVMPPRGGSGIVNALAVFPEGAGLGGIYYYPFVLD